MSEKTALSPQSLSAKERMQLQNLVKYNEEWLMNRVLAYAKRQNYTRFTSTLPEAWRLSIEGLSRALLNLLQAQSSIPEMSPDKDYNSDAAAQFGIEEARKHRHRGVSLSMFLGLMKYYRQSYIDMLHAFIDDRQEKASELMINRFFDHVELAFCNEWSGIDAETQIRELSHSNLMINNEKNRYLTIFESSNLPIIFFNREGKIENLNNAAAEAFYYYSAPGYHYYNNSLIKELAWMSEELAECISSQSESGAFVKQLPEADGSRIFNVYYKRVLDVSETYSGYIFTYEDITKQHQAEQEIRASNKAQEALISELEKTKEQLVQHEKLAALGQLAAGIAHEINNPIGYVRANCKSMNSYINQLFGFIDELDQSEVLSQANLEQLKTKTDYHFLKSDSLELIGETMQGLDRITHIIKDLKSFARSGKESFIEADINQLIDSALNVAHNEIKYRAEVIREYQKLPLITCVPHAITQVFLNLLVNAAQAIAEKGSTEHGIIKVGTKLEGDKIVIEVSDNGSGMDEQTLTRLFEPFYTTKPVGQGTGLGLSVSYGIIEKHHGEISVKSTLNQGSTFSITLPVKLSA